MRYTASTLRGCLLESLDWLRPNPDAAAREAGIDEDAKPDDEHLEAPAPAWAALTDFLQGRQVGRLTGRRLRLLSINDPRLQAQLDQEPAVRALLDSTEGRTVLAPRGRNTPRLDQAAIRLSTPFGRDLTQVRSVAIWDRRPRPDGIHHRRRHDDDEHCWRCSITPRCGWSSSRRSRPPPMRTTGARCRTSPTCGGWPCRRSGRHR